jgi:hypothetical protein
MKVITTKQGNAKRNRGNGILNWSRVVEMFPQYHEHIYRVRNNYEKLVGLRNRLVIKFGGKYE